MRHRAAVLVTFALVHLTPVPLVPLVPPVHVLDTALGRWPALQDATGRCRHYRTRDRTRDGASAAPPPRRSHQPVAIAAEVITQTHPIGSANHDRSLGHSDQEAASALQASQ